jgi:hypothetical protein
MLFVPTVFFCLFLPSCKKIPPGLAELSHPVKGEAMIFLKGEEHHIGFSLSAVPESGGKRDAVLRFLQSSSLSGLELTYKGGVSSASVGKLSTVAHGLEKILDVICYLSPFEIIKSGVSSDGNEFFIGADGQKLIFSSDGILKELRFRDIYVKIVWIEY